MKIKTLFVLMILVFSAILVVADNHTNSTTINDTTNNTNNDTNQTNNDNQTDTNTTEPTTTALSIWDSGVYEVGEDIEFFANYTANSTLVLGADCQITFDNTSFAMSENTDYYKYEKVFDQNGTFDYSVICSKENYTDSSANSTVTIIAEDDNVTEELISLTIWDNGPKEIDEDVKFFANYTYNNTLVINASCQITFDNVTSTMQDDDEYYNYERTFDNNGTFEYSVSCSKEEYETKNATETVTITVDDDDNQTGTNVTDDFDFSECGVTPENRYRWGIDRAMERISLALTFGKSAKAQKGLVHARERLCEVRLMLTQKKLAQAERAQKSYDKSLKKVKLRVREHTGDNETEFENEIETKLKKHEKYVQDFGQLRQRIQGQLNSDQQAALENLISSFENSTNDLRVEVEQKKQRTKIKIRARELSGQEIKIEIETENDSDGKGSGKNKITGKAVFDVNKSLEVRERIKEKLKNKGKGKNR